MEIDRLPTKILADRRACSVCGERFIGSARYCGMCGRRLEIASEPGTVGEYAIEERIAEGGFATIYRARHIPSGSQVALKILHADLSSDERVTARFRREAQRLLQLRNPNTVTTYDYGETTDGTQYIVMELLRGETLAQRLEATITMPWREVLRVMRAVCRALGEAHALGIVHRDLKPANILIGHDDVVKLLDFGLAKTAADENLTRAGQTVGTLPYMAPEQLRGHACDGRTDIFALGVVGFEMITGRRPLENDPAAIVPAEVELLLRRCLARDPAARFANVGELIAAIEGILVPRRACMYPHTPAFELDPPRIVAEVPPAPAFVGETAEMSPRARRRLLASVARLAG